MSDTRIPTPADVARRRTPPPSTPKPARRTKAKAALPKRRVPYVPRELTTEEWIGPGRLENWEHFRPFYRHGMTVSGMTAPARLVGHDLLWRANHRNGRIAVEDQPTADVIAESTGLSIPQILVAVQVLASRGWLIVRRLADGREAFDLVIPAGVLEGIRVQRDRHRTN